MGRFSVGIAIASIVMVVAAFLIGSPPTPDEYNDATSLCTDVTLTVLSEGFVININKLKTLPIVTVSYGEDAFGRRVDKFVGYPPSIEPPQKGDIVHIVAFYRCKDNVIEFIGADWARAY